MTAELEDVRTFVVASAVLSLFFCVGLRGYQMHGFMADHLGQLPQYRGTELRIQFIDPSYAFYGGDLVQNDPFLRSKDVRLLTRGPEANAALMRQLHADFHQVYQDFRGEVWSAAPVTRNQPQ